MTRNNFYAAMMAIAMMFATGNAFAQGNRGGHGGNMDRGGNHGGNPEMKMHGDGRVEMRGGQHVNYNGSHNGNMGHNDRRDYDYRGHNNYNDRRDYNHHNDYRDHRDYNHHNDYAHHGGNPRLDNRGYVHGWEGRVRHDNGRWGYFRDNRWYWYDRYFEPNYYYANPVGYFNDYYYLADGGYIPGYEGRVIYRGGRWGYLRGRDWYWYDRYFEPEYYYAHPVAHFHSYISPVGRRVVAGVAGAVVLGSIIHALVH